MMIATLDTTKLVILMLAGGVFAVAGLWLMLRPKPETGAAKIELFGLKFEAASAGLLVFLTGAGFMAVPVFVPERDAPRLPAEVLTDALRSSTPSGTSSSKAPASAVPFEGTSEGGRATPTPIPNGVIPPRQRASGTEVEPNDDYESANQIAVGGSVRGVVHPEMEDWFVVPVNATAAGLHVSLRNLEGSDCYIHFYSAVELELHDRGYFPKQHTVQSWEVTLDGSGGAFLRLEASWTDCRYELFTSYSDAQSAGE